jgi:hypothetical protein
MLKMLPRDRVYTGRNGVLVRKVLTSHGRRCILVLTKSVDMFLLIHYLLNVMTNKRDVALNQRNVGAEDRAKMRVVSALSHCFETRL